MRLSNTLSMIACMALATSVAIGGDTPLLDQLIGGIEDDAGEFSWYGIRTGMTLRQAEELLQVRLVTEQDEFFGWAANTAYRGFGLTLEMSDDGRDAEIRGITLSMPEPLDVREMADALKRRLPGVRYRASRHSPELKEQDNPSPGYVLCEECDVNLWFKPQLVWIQGRRGRGD